MSELWKQKINQMREKFPTFMPLVISREHGDYVWIDGQEVPWEDYCQHIGVAHPEIQIWRVEDRYPMSANNENYVGD